MDEDHALGKVGLANPGGDPQRIATSAESWQELSNHLQQQSDQIGALLAESQTKWAGQASDAFQERTKQLASRMSESARLAASVRVQQQHHSVQHEKVLKIVKEIAIQIAVTLAFIALACVFPWLLAAAEAQLVNLAVQGGRVIQMLVDALSVLIRGLNQARTWLEQLSKLSWRGESFSFGYGRLLAEGGGDFAIDLAGNSTSKAIQHQKLDPAQLLMSAAVSFGVGGMVGSLENSALKRVRGESGDIARAADGKPKFVTFGNQAKNLVNKLKSDKPAPAPAVSPTDGSRQLFDRLGRAQSAARKQGLTGTRAEEDRLNQQLRATEDERQAATARHSAAESTYRQTDELRRQSQSAMTQRAAELRQAESHLGDTASGQWSSELLHDLSRVQHGDARIPPEIAQQMRAATENHAAAEQRHAAATSALNDARTAYARAVEQHRTAGQQLDGAATNLAASTDRLASVRTRMAACNQLREAHEAVLHNTSGAQRFLHALKNNPWRNSFGSPKKWPEVILYNGMLKDAAKGTMSSAAVGGINVAQGKLDPHDLWKNVLLGTAGGSVRGMVNAKITNRAYPKDGLEEVVAKSGTKSLDLFTRGQIGEAINKPVDAQPAVNAP